ncbi:MAG: MmcQ/YjbR family DNA-binding protein [Erysipelotrichaceae bacterium]|nr:MmcQ/YjbR family DNA-binding protein [Erysipelotrichaceae bacterium]
MKLEEEVLGKYEPLKERLIAHGFLEAEDGSLTIAKPLLNGLFQAEITVTPEKKTEGRIMDLDAGEEYINYRIESNVGSFVTEVREAYRSLLEEIREYAYREKMYLSDQANRIDSYINKRYQVSAEFPWEDKTGAVYRNSANQKWFALFMQIPKKRIDAGEEPINIVNVKLPEPTVKHLLKKKGYYPAYHMNKTTWITLILDGSLSDEEVKERIDASYEGIAESSSWIVPANPKYYDIVKEFDTYPVAEWKQSSDIALNDIVYMYVGAPYSALLYRCKAVEVSIPYDFDNGQVRMKYVMKLEILDRYPKDAYPFEMLKKAGIRAVRGPRRITEKQIEKIFGTKAGKEG